MLLETYTCLLQEGWQDVFSQERTQRRAIEHALTLPMVMGRRTISRTICGLGRADRDWSADYKLFSRSDWETEGLFAPVLREYLCRYPKGPIGSADRVPAKDRRRGMKQPKVDQHGVYIQKIGNGEWKYELKAILPFFVRFLSISDPLKVADPLS